VTNYSVCDYKQCGKKISKNKGWGFYNADFSLREIHDDGDSYDLCDEHGQLIKKEIIGDLT